MGGQDGAELAATALHSRLAKYDKNFRPGYGEPPLQVAVRLLQLAVEDDNEVRIQLSVSWQDLRLAHQVEGVQEIRLVADRASDIWQPELVIGKGLHGVSSLLLRPNGGVELTTRVETHLNCVPPLLSPLYPQVCSLTIETVCNDPTSVAISWMPDPPLFSPSPSHLEVLAYRQISSSPSSLSISLLTQRSFPHLLLKSYLPYLLHLLPSLLSLFLPPSLPCPRLLLSLLPLLLLLHSFQNTSHPPLLYSLGCLTIGLLLLIYTVLIILLHEGEGNQRNGQVRENVGRCRCRGRPRELDLVGKVVFPVLVLIFNLVYFNSAFKGSDEYDGFTFLNSTNGEL